MVALYLTIFISLIIALIFLVLFLSSVKNNQYEDTYTPSVRMLFEDEFGAQPDGKEYKKDKNQNNN
jgi:cbb3-type cytochrome oxidase maturation protein